MIFYGRDYISLRDFRPEEIQALVDLAIRLKKELKEEGPRAYLAGKSLAMIFEKSSTRTRVSFEVGMQQLGGQALFLSHNDIQLGRGESIPDTARVLSRYVDAIMIRTFAHTNVTELATYADIPIINGLTDDYHPTQALADLVTIQEHKGDLKGLVWAYLGDGNNMCHSIMIAGMKMGMEVRLACPEGYQPSPEILAYCQGLGSEVGGQVLLTQDPKTALNGADIVYTDTWASMGQESEKADRIQAFSAYQVNQDMMRMAKDDAIFMHCLPAYRGMEVTEEVIEGPQSVVFDEAENRLHAHKAILLALMSQNEVI